MDFQKASIHTLANEKLNEIYLEHQELQVLDALLAKKPDGSWPWSMLSDWTLDVSNLMINISEIVSVCISAYNSEYSFRLMYEQHGYHQLRDKKLTAKDAEMFAKDAGQQYRIEELVAHEVADRLKSKEKAVWNLISVTQTRLSSLRAEMSYSRGQV